MDYAYKWRAMLVVSIGVFMATLDGSIVNIALPTLTNYFDTDLATIEWILLAYLLTITALLLTFGRLSDIYGRKPIFSAGLLIFTVGSGLCSLSASPAQLIASRVVQGVGAAMIMANGPAIITSAFPSTERGKALGLIGTVVSIGSTAGPVLGGFLIDWIGWRSIFYINIPVGLFGAAYAARSLEPEEAGGGQRFDIKGAVLMSISLTSLTLGIAQGQELGWDSPVIIGLFVTFLVFLLLFIQVELKASVPMVELSLFKIRPFSAANTSSFLSFVAMFAVLLLMPYYMEGILGYSTRHVGMALIAVPLAMALVAPLSGWLYDKTESFLLSSVGMAISCLALLSLGSLDKGSSFADVVIRLSLLGLGMGLFQAPNSTIVMGSVPRNRLGVAASLLATVRNLGMVTGIAISGALFTRGLYVYQAAGSTYESAFIGGFRDAFTGAAIICAVGVLTSLVRGRGGGQGGDRISIRNSYIL